MPHAIESSTIRILKPTGETIGTGFLVSKTLAVTCAHVIKLLGAGPNSMIDISFTGKSAPTTAKILPEYWRPDEATDIAILQVDEVPPGVFPLRMGRASESKLKNDLYTFGYAFAANEQGIGGLGTFITAKDDSNFVQLRMNEAYFGHSGAPVYDEKRRLVIGMIKKGHAEKEFRNVQVIQQDDTTNLKGVFDSREGITFAISTETIWQVCPQLKPVISPLPRRNPIVDGINLLPYDYDQRIQNFLTEYLGTDSHPVPFGGRDEALKMLDGWLAETTPYLLLAAPAGRGKSALLVRWLDSLKTREDLALAFVPISIRFGTNMERVFYAALAARLAFLQGDDIPASPETSTAVYRGLVADYLSKPLANGRTLLVVLDGLDEAADWQAGADFMPGELPTGVRVVVSARFLAGDADSTSWLRRLNWEHVGLASAPSLIPLDQDGVRDVLFKMGCPLDELSRNVNIVTELYRLSEGDPLLVGLYVGDLWTKSETTIRLQPEDLAGIQPGYTGYFDHWWDDQKKLWGQDKPWLEKHVRAVRNLLAGALGPLFKDDFQALDSELESDYLADALDVLQRFIIGDNQIQGYTYSHPKLGQYFWEKLSKQEQINIGNLFISWGDSRLAALKKHEIEPKQVSAYIIQYLGAHLESSHDWNKLDKLVCQEWFQSWLELTDSPDGFVNDVDRARQVAVFQRKIVFQIRYELIYSSICSLSLTIPEDLLNFLLKHRYSKFQAKRVFWMIKYRPIVWQKADAFFGAGSFLPDELIPGTLGIVLKIARQNERGILGLTSHPSIRMLGEIIPLLTGVAEEYQLVLFIEKISERIVPELIPPILNLIKDMKDSGQRMIAAGCILSKLSLEDRNSILREMLDLASKADSNSVTKALSYAAPYLSRREIHNALKVARPLPHNSVFEYMSLVKIYAYTKEYKKMLSFIHYIYTEKELYETIAEIADIVPQNQQGKLLKLLPKSPHYADRAYALAAIAQNAHPRLENTLIKAIEEVDMYDDIKFACFSALLPHLRTPKNIKRIQNRIIKLAREVFDVGSWGKYATQISIPNLSENIADKILDEYRGNYEWLHVAIALINNFSDQKRALLIQEIFPEYIDAVQSNMGGYGLNMEQVLHLADLLSEDLRNDVIEILLNKHPQIINDSSDYLATLDVFNAYIQPENQNFYNQFDWIEKDMARSTWNMASQSIRATLIIENLIRSIEKNISKEFGRPHDDWPKYFLREIARAIHLIPEKYCSKLQDYLLENLRLQYFNLGLSSPEFHEQFHDPLEIITIILGNENISTEFKTKIIDLQVKNIIETNDKTLGTFILLALDKHISFSQKIELLKILQHKPEIKKDPNTSWDIFNRTGFMEEFNKLCPLLIESLKYHGPSQDLVNFQIAIAQLVDSIGEKVKPEYLLFLCKLACLYPASITNLAYTAMQNLVESELRSHPRPEKSVQKYIPWLKDNLLYKALILGIESIFSKLDDAESWSDDLVTLCGYWAQLPMEHVTKIWDVTFPQIAKSTRSLFLVKLNALAPVTMRFGGEQIVHEIRDEIDLIRVRWP